MKCVLCAPVPAACIHAGGVSNSSASASRVTALAQIIGRRVSPNAPSRTSFWGGSARKFHLGLSPRIRAGDASRGADPLARRRGTEKAEIAVMRRDVYREGGFLFLFLVVVVVVAGGLGWMILQHPFRVCMHVQRRPLVSNLN